MKKLFYNKLKLILLGSAVLWSVSCKKLIEVPKNPLGQIAESELFSDSLSALSAVAGVYNYEPGSGKGFAFSDNSLARLTGMSGDDLSTTISYSTTIAQFYNNALQADNGSLNPLWGNYYKSIYQINAIIAGLNGSTGITPSLKNQLSGEMEVARALYYFNLINIYGSVPLVLSTDYKTTGQQPRADPEVIYKQILADLTDARNKLVENYPSGGHLRPNLYVAEALLAKVYLYRQDWQKAYDAADKVINSGVYTLENDPNAVFLDGSQEAIWQLPSLVTYAQTQDAQDFVPNSGDIPSYPISDNLLQKFDTSDKRFNAWVGQTEVDQGNGQKTYYYPGKYKNTNSSASTTEDFMVLRMAEQYLIRAEAAAHLGNSGIAVEDINKIRSRAGLAEITFKTQQDLLDKIMQERQVELFCEWGNRWFDLKRTKTIDAVLGREKPNWQSFKSLYPVPLAQIRVNSNLTQNTGY
jgi:hypothetical protein